MLILTRRILHRNINYNGDVMAENDLEHRELFSRKVCDIIKIIMKPTTKTDEKQRIIIKLSVKRFGSKN